MRSFAVLIMLFCFVNGERTSDPTSATTNVSTTIAPTANTEPTPTGAPNTTKPEKHTTTAKPTTTAEPTTTPAPTGDPVNNYTVVRKNETCLLAKFSGHFTNKTDKTTSSIGSDARMYNATSDCGNLTVTFGKNRFTIHFNQTTTKHFYITGVNATINGVDIGNSDENLDVAKAANGSSYMCKSGLTIQMTQNFSFAMKDLQVQPFWVNKDGTFSTALQCTGDYPKNMLVPIIVGCALGGLIVLVLLAYCVIRSRVNKTYDPVDTI